MKAPLVDSALRDDQGLGDVAYISLGALMIATVGPILIMTVMGVVAYFRCTPTAYLVKETMTVIECKYDPQPLGSAIGFACGGFGVALGALAGYMAATRRPQGSSTITTRQETVTATPAAPMQDKPMEVAVVDQAKPIEVVESKPKRRTK